MSNIIEVCASDLRVGDLIVAGFGKIERIASVDSFSFMNSIPSVITFVIEEKDGSEYEIQLEQYQVMHRVEVA